MATESPLFHDGSQTTLSTTQDARRSSISGTTNLGPNGSGQFLVVTVSTTVDRTVLIASTAPSAPNVGLNYSYGVLQNTPKGGEAADVGIFGVSKVVAATTSFTRGQLVTASTLVSGGVTLYSTALAYRPVGIALESPTSTGAVISVYLAPTLGGST